MNKVKTERITFEVPVHLKRLFTSIVASRGRSQSSVLRKFVQGYVKKGSK
jgi:hypothetical protein